MIKSQWCAYVIRGVFQCDVPDSLNAVTSMEVFTATRISYPWLDRVDVRSGRHGRWV